MLSLPRQPGRLALLLLALAGSRAAGQDMFERNRRAIENNTVEHTKTAGFGVMIKPFHELSRSNGYLMGFELGLGRLSSNHEVIYTVTPLYRGPSGEARGQTYGQTQDRAVAKTGIKQPIARLYRVVARDGYAVSGLTVYANASIDGMQVHCARVNGTRLDGADIYSSEWIGSQRIGGARPQTIGTGENPVVGIFGSLSQNGWNCIALGLTYRDARAAVAPPDPKPTDRPVAEPKPAAPPTDQPVAEPKPAAPPTAASPAPMPTTPAMAAVPAGANWGLVFGVFALVAAAAFGVFYALSQKQAPPESEQEPV